MKTISVLIPSRGNPVALCNTIDNCLYAASYPDRLEFVVRIDHDDKSHREYRDRVGLALRAGIDVKLRVDAPLGYRRMHDYYEEMYLLSKGDFLLAYNDDMTIETQGWDVEFERALEPVPYGVASCDMREGNGNHYEWAMPMVRRDLCELIGRFCCGTETCDRIFDSYARQSGRGVKANVWMVHDWQPLQPGSQRNEVYTYAMSHWGEMTSRWDSAAREMVAKVMQAPDVKNVRARDGQSVRISAVQQTTNKRHIMKKLGMKVSDEITGRQGMLTAFTVLHGGNEYYGFQPVGTNPETGHPIKPDWMGEGRILGAVDVPEPEIYRRVLGTSVVDDASGVSGRCVSVTLHLSGCVHINIQPEGTLKNGNCPDELNVDIRRCSGAMIPKWTEEQIAKDREKRPSPGEVPDRPCY